MRLRSAPALARAIPRWTSILGLRLRHTTERNELASTTNRHQYAPMEPSVRPFPLMPICVHLWLRTPYFGPKVVVERHAPTPKANKRTQGGTLKRASVWAWSWVPLRCPKNFGQWTRGILPLRKGDGFMSKGKRYEKSFKLQAARLVADHGYSFEEAGARLGVSAWSVRSWLNQFRASGELPGRESRRPRPMSGTLREENRKLRLENDILKKPPRTSPRTACEVRMDGKARG